MTDHGKPTQPTQPRDPNAKPVQIPIPTREAFLRDLRKVAPPAKQESGGDAQKDRA